MIYRSLIVSARRPLHYFGLGFYFSLTILFALASVKLPVWHNKPYLDTVVEKWQAPIPKPFDLPPSLNPIVAAPTIATTSGLRIFNPFQGFSFFRQTNSQASIQVAAWQIDQPNSADLINKIASQPTAIWLGDWTPDVQSAAAKITIEAAAQNAIPVLVAYNLPQRDCGSYSSGGATSAEVYKTWINQLATGIGSRRAVVILEPDSLGVIDCLSASDLAERYALLSSATHILSSLARTSVYIDAGHSNWLSPSEIASRLNKSGILEAQGFATNISNFYDNKQENTYAKAVSQLVGGKHYVIDSGRNGLGANNQWCNPETRALGTKPQAGTGLLDAYLWVKTPGESDGTCNGGPPAGTFWPDYALGLARRASF